MNQRGKNNSIVFLTTLSVYLGLVLVGGALSPVLAQAATTRNFNVQDEIEVKDDLDKNPNDEELKKFSGEIEDYFEQLENFIVDLQKLHSIEKFDLNYDKFALNTASFIPCDVNGDPIVTKKISKTIDNIWLEPAITEAIYRFEDLHSLSDCLPNGDFDTDKVTSSVIKFSFDKLELKVELSGLKSSPQKARQSIENFDKAYSIYRPDEEEIIVRAIYENTSFKSEKNQVFIVTRLPRGSLDALLAKDAN